MSRPKPKPAAIDTGDPRLLLSLARSALNEGIAMLREIDPDGVREVTVASLGRTFVIDENAYVLRRIDDALHTLDAESYPKLTLSTIGNVLTDVADSLALEESRDAQEAVADLRGAAVLIGRVIAWLGDPVPRGDL
jgi:hypothetical protein